MSVEAHVNALNTKKSSLDQAIMAESHRPNPDQVRISELKREKLRVKEQIDRFL